MSYEGHYQILCRKGHAICLPENYEGGPYFVQETDKQKEERLAGEFGFHASEIWKCHCGELAGWYNAVDDTNCDAAGEMRLVEVTPEETASCNMGHTHVTKDATYRPGELVNPEDHQNDHYINGGLL